MSYTLFIADLHLVVADKKSDLFIKFCRQQTQCKQLFILGDLFNTYLGDDISINSYKPIISALKELAKTTKIFIIKGNRDFLIANEFAKCSGCKIIPSHYKVVINNQKYLLTHGDELCTDDKDYQILKKILQHPITKFIFLNLSNNMRLKLSGQLRKKSINAQKKKSKVITDINQQTTNNLMAQHLKSNLIHGHTHRQNIHQEINYTRYVLGSWSDNKGNALKISSDDSPKWLSIF